MRKAYSNFRLIIENDQFIGVSLGYDFCAEHEWGIKGITRQFGIGVKKDPNFFQKVFNIKIDPSFGISKRLITEGEVILREKGDLTILVSKQTYWKQKPVDEITFEDLATKELSLYDKDICTAWDENNFGVLVKGKDNRKYLKELEQAFKDKNIAIAFYKTQNPFENASLSLLIANKLEKEVVDEMYTVDKKAHDLVEYEKAIGVTELKEKVKGNGYKKSKYYCACSPKWINYEDAEKREEYKAKMNTKYDIQFWINYSDDDDNFGWYTAEEIIKWLSTPNLKLTQIRKA